MKNVKALLGGFLGFILVIAALVLGIHFNQDNEIPVSLEITPEMMAQAEKQIDSIYIEETPPLRMGTISGNTRYPRAFLEEKRAFYGFGGSAKVGQQPSKGIIKKRLVQDEGKYYVPPRYWQALPQENKPHQTSEEALSTFSLDVDTASYANLRNQLSYSYALNPDMIRIEEMINYFSYTYPVPEGDQPLRASTEVAQTPWSKESRLLRIAVKAKEIPMGERPASNFVFLIDASGSMAEYKRLPLVKKSLKLLVEQLRPQDRVALVVYAGNAGVYLNSTSGEEKSKILAAIAAMKADGTTNGSAGIELAYKIANKNFIKGGINRVILASDGDFNVGISDSKELGSFISEKAKTGVFLSVMGYGMGNYVDENMQSLANKGNGNYAYIDSLNEAKKFLVEQASGTLMTVAKDVKAQVEFNPKVVKEYRMVGYEKGQLQTEDFANDQKDAGDIGAGHTVTVFYEIVLQPEVNSKDSLGTIKFRFKSPEANESRVIETAIANDDKSFEKASSDFQFAAAVAEFGQLLRNSSYKGDGTFDQVLRIAMDHTVVGGQEDTYRNEFLDLVKQGKIHATRTSVPLGNQGGIIWK